MFKKSSRTKNIRRKVHTTEDDATTVEEVVIQKTATLADKKKKVKKTTLSFEAEEEGDDSFRIKKKTLGPASDWATLDPEMPSTRYDIDTLNQLRQNTPSMSTMKTGDALLHEKFPSTANSTVPTTGIPDASAILVAKKKREQLRKGFVVTEQDDGFIALEDTEEDKTGGRLVREEDEDFGDDGEAELDKYVGGSFTINQGKAKKIDKERKEGLREMILEAEEDLSDADGMGKWEEDMIKHGGAKTQKQENDPFAVPSNYRPARVPESTALPTLTDIMSSLSLATNDLNFSSQQRQQHLAETQMTMNTHQSTEKDLEKEIERASGRYTYFQELAQYVNDLGECLDSKFPELETLEDKVHELFVSETELAITRHEQDSMDDLLLFANINLEEEGQEEVDEFGRVKEWRYSESASRRRREERKKRAAQLLQTEDLTAEEEAEQQGLWTDDEFDDDGKRSDQLNAIETTEIDNLLKEIGDEYRSLEMVKSKFEAWKTTYYEDYQKAFGSLSLPGAFEFFIRLELLTWNPFSDPIEFDSMEWHKTLSEYGVSAEHEDPDTEMLNKVVEKCMTKKIRSLLDTVNGRSSRQMRYASQVLEQLSYYIDTNGKAYKDLAQEFIQILDKQIDRIAKVTETMSLKPDLDPEAKKAKQRLFSSYCKYLKTLALLRRQLPEDLLQPLNHKISRVSSRFS
ncbi:nineteen complex-related protein 2-domain-containing protein [Sporodiniella umbellata]|nr:nineteen complex-related protein 2-domain-containing protein [Sporodiniella umbellata]